MTWPGYVPWREPRSSGNYAEMYPTHYNFAPAVERVARDVVKRFNVSVNSYHLHPPAAPAYERVSLDVWGRRGRGDWLDGNLGRQVFGYLFNLPGEPEIEWAIYGGRMWVRGEGWQPSPPGPPDSDAEHNGHIHISYALKYDVPKDDAPRPGRTLSSAIDDYFAANYHQFGPYEPVGKVIVEEAAGNIDVALAAAIVEKESGGRLIFGCDAGSMFCHDAVTRDRMQRLLKHINAGGVSNGVGLTQLTWPPFIYEAEAMGGAHIPRYQCRVGFRLMSDLIYKLGYDDALAAYNAGEGNLAAGRAYARDLAMKHGVWKSRLAGLTEPQKPEPGYTVTIGSKEKPLKKKHAENIARAHRKHGRDARVEEVGMAQGNRIPYAEWEAMATHNVSPQPQNQPVEAGGPGPSNRTPENEETALRPTRKISAVAAAGAITTIVLYVLNMYGVEPPPELGAAIATVVALVLGYLVPEGS